MEPILTTLPEEFYKVVDKWYNKRGKGTYSLAKNLEYLNNNRERQRLLNGLINAGLKRLIAQAGKEKGIDPKIVGSTDIVRHPKSGQIIKQEPIGLEITTNFDIRHKWTRTIYITRETLFKRMIDREKDYNRLLYSNSPLKPTKKPTATMTARKCSGKLHRHCSICGMCFTNAATHDRGHM